MPLQTNHNGAQMVDNRAATESTSFTWNFLKLFSLTLHVVIRCLCVSCFTLIVLFLFALYTLLPVSVFLPFLSHWFSPVSLRPESSPWLISPVFTCPLVLGSISGSVFLAVRIRRADTQERCAKDCLISPAVEGYLKYTLEMSTTFGRCIYWQQDNQM